MPLRTLSKKRDKLHSKVQSCKLYEYTSIIGVLWIFFVILLVIPRHNSVDHTKPNSVNIVFFYVVTEHKLSFFSVGLGGNLPRGS